MKYAVIENDKVVNVIEWDGIAQIPFNNLIQSETLGIGMELIEGEWIMPEQPVNDWEHPDYSMRIVVPTTLIEQYPMMLFDLTVRRKLPLEEGDGVVCIYCNEILESDQSLVDQLEGVIVVEERPLHPPQSPL